MNPEAQEMFNDLVKLNPEDLSQEQIGFLYGRRPYMNHLQEQTFAEVFKAIAKANEPIQEAEIVEDKPVKKAK